MTLVNPQRPPEMSLEARLMEKIATLQRELRSMQALLSGGATAQFPVVTALPTGHRKGRAVVLASNGKLYVDDGTNWNPQT